MRPDGPRPEIVGPPDGPQAPFPLRLSGPVIAGFGRGSAELGIPTANIPIEGLSVGGCEDVESGVYYGWAGLGSVPEGRSGEKDDVEEVRRPGKSMEEVGEVGEVGKEKPRVVYPMVMSIGWNPYYKNTVRSIEVHLLYTFPKPFYGAPLYLTILGFIRPEYDYVSKESLIEDIKTDIEVARRCLERDKYNAFREEQWLLGGAKDNC